MEEAPKSSYEKNAIKVRNRKKQFCQPMRKKTYSFLAPKASKHVDFSMDLCCKMAELGEFGKTWVYVSFLPIIDNGF